MAVSYANFGVNDRKLYDTYLRIYEKVHDGRVRDCDKFNFRRSTIHNCVMGIFGDCGFGCRSNSGDAVWSSGATNQVIKGVVDGGSVVCCSCERGRCFNADVESGSGSGRFDTGGSGTDDGAVGTGIGESGCGQGSKVVDGDDVSVVSEKTLRNREKRLKKKDRKLRKQLQQRVGGDVPEWRRDVVVCAKTSVDGVSDGEQLSRKRTGYFSELCEDSRKALRESRAARLEAENKLQQARAERALELLRASDIEKVKKMNETRVMRNTELNKVKVERAFSHLSATGNVAGFAETVVSGAPTLSSGSISPNSSVSAAEVYAMQKELLELQVRDKEFGRLKESVKKYLPESVYDNLVREAAETVDTSFTADTMGHELANGGGYHLCDDGRYRSGERFEW